MKAFLIGDSRIALLLLQGCVLAVLLIAIVNVANLQVARATAREREFAIRTALGAERSPISRQLLTESLVLAAIGGAAGFALAQWGVHAVHALASDALPRMSEVTVDSRVLMVSTALSVASGILFGLVPVFRGPASRVGQDLKSTIGSGEPAARHRLLGILVVAEFSLAVILLTGAGLLARSFERLLSATPGFSPQHLITMQLALSGCSVSPGITGCRLLSSSHCATRGPSRRAVGQHFHVASAKSSRIAKPVSNAK